MLQVTCSSSAWPAQSGIPLLHAVTSLYSLTHASDDLILENDILKRIHLVNPHRHKK